MGDDLVVWDLGKVGWFRKKPMLCVPLDRVTGAIAFARNALVAVEEGRAHVFENGELLRSFDVPVCFETPWMVNEDEMHLAVGGNQALFRFRLADGSLERVVEAAIPRPERLPPLQLAREHDILGGATMWRTVGGAFLHQSDGPRGWVQPVELSCEGIAVVPSAAGAAALRVTDDSVRYLGSVPFEGKLRASRVTDGEVLLVNQQGRLFRSALPHESAAT